MKWFKSKSILAGLITAFIVIISLVGFVLYANFSEQQENERLGVKFVKEGEEPITDVGWSEDNNSFFYKGKSGENALKLLKAYTNVKQDTSGLVISVNDRVADSKKWEYWAFYVNGKMSQVGPADYKTKDEDLIEWKIEKY